MALLPSLSAARCRQPSSGWGWPRQLQRAMPTPAALSLYEPAEHQVAAQQPWAEKHRRPRRGLHRQRRLDNPTAPGR